MAATNVDFKAKALEAGRVFTPTSPIDELSLFAGREEQIRLIVDVVNQKGNHALLFGERGVGKTSLSNVLSSILNRPQSVVAPRVNCDTLDTFESVWKKIFDQISLTRSLPTAGFESTPAKRIDSGLDLLPSEISPDSVRKALTQLSVSVVPILIVDEFDRLPQEPRRAFADTIKMLSDFAVPATVVLVGVADSVEQLVQEHQSVERALVQIRMPRMSSEEINKILDIGLGRLEMTIQASARKRITRLVQGLPHYAHLLGLHASRAALDAQRTDVTNEAVQVAIERAVDKTQQSIRTAYEFAITSPRKDNLFSDVLLSCAVAETNELGFFAAQDVREPLRNVTGTRYEIPSFARHLNDFCEQKRGPMLQKIGSKRRFRYRFINPMMQPFVIMQGLKAGRIKSSSLD